MCYLKWKRFLLLILMFCSLAFSLKAQEHAEAEKKVQLLLSQKEYAKALPLLDALFQSAPYDKNYYDEYYKVLLIVKSYDTAIALGQYMTKIRREDLTIYVDIGQAYTLKGDKKQAQSYFEDAITSLNGNEMQAKSLASAFRLVNLPEYELKTYEQVRSKNRNPYVFAYEIALLYDKKGEVEKAVELMLNLLSVQPYGVENAKQALDVMIAGDTKKLKKVESIIAKKLKEDPYNYLWKELLIWAQNSKGDKTEQLKDLIQLDESQGQQGILVYNWCKDQYQKEEYELALQGLNYLLSLPKNNVTRSKSAIMYLFIQEQKLEKTFPIAATQVQKLLNDFNAYFTEYPQIKNGESILSFAKVLALFAHEPQAAIDTLNNALNAFNIAPEIKGKALLDIGDYQILLGNVWQAALQYSQVDKAFKEDYLGEEARFRNAMLSYYRGDFEYAQGQLSVLKASTSELIANDALYLSVLITENTPEDKNFDAFKAFSRADLLQFQHKYDEAEILLDSLTLAEPNSELQDDIQMKLAMIAIKKMDFQKAVIYLQTIQNKYGDDVLADDATFKLAIIYEEQFKDLTKAKAAYEKIIIDFPSSSFAQQSRAKLEELSKLKS